MVVVCQRSASEVAWEEGEAATIAAVSAMNRAAAALVDTVAMLDVTNGWHGWGIRSLSHWVQWKANMSAHRADGFVLIARRRGDLPACWALFAEGRLTEEAMARIARRVPPERDTEIAAAAPGMTVHQLSRILATLPPLPAPDDGRGPEQDPEQRRERYLRLHRRPDGSVHGEFQLPVDDAAVVDNALAAARDRVFRDQHGLDDTAEPGAGPRTVNLADAFVRLAAAATDALDGHLQRTGRPGDRHQLVIHRDLRPDGTLGPARCHLGAHLPDALARYLSCDTDLTVAVHHGLELLGFTPTERTPNRRLRRWIEHRDGGCVHPLCTARRWLHLHHLHHWEDGGPTIGSNLVALCPAHHRALHQGDFTIAGDPEGDHPLVFRTRHGLLIEPPRAGGDPPPPGDPPPTYRPPYGERLTSWSWN